MREIKFRTFVEHLDSTGGDNNYSYMIYDVEFLGNINEIFATSGVKPLNPLHNKLTYMQYTGLKDKNGKEIYEGDILIGHPGIPCAVGWDEDNACFNALSSNKRICISTFAFKDREIIGNIYENQELVS